MRARPAIKLEFRKCAALFVSAVGPEIDRGNKDLDRLARSARLYRITLRRARNGLGNAFTLRSFAWLTWRAGGANLLAQRIHHRRIGRRTCSRKAGYERKASEKTA
jgi:hypothetical protein